MKRFWIEWISFIYFGTHIPITILFDIQPIFPFQPKWARDLVKSIFIKNNNNNNFLKDFYIPTFHDPLFGSSNPLWFKSFLIF